jgi:phospholipid/cholesterol/gamma-HCH transport system substrate-binding protein
MSTKKQIWMETVVGLMGFALIAALFVLTVILSSEALFSRPSPLQILFDDVMGLRVGDNVVARGVTIGKVKGIEFAPQGVLVTAMLDSPVSLNADYRIEVQPSSLLGGRNLVIQQGNSSEPLPPDAVLRGVAPPDLVVSATAAVEEIRAALNGGIVDDFKATLANFRSISDGLANGEGTLGRLLKDEAMADGLRSAIDGFRDIGDAIAKGEGTLGKLVKDDALYDDAAAIAANLRALSESLGKGEGTLGKLMSDDTLYTDASAVAASLRTVSDSLAKGEGTLGKLLSDDTLYTDLQAILREGRAAIDDMRETSPITTFTSLFFGIF